MASKRKKRPDGTFAKKGEKSELLDPRQMDFLNRYLDPDSESYANAYQSALAAGYGEEYAKNLTAQGTKWLSDNLQNYESRFDEDLLYEKHIALLNKVEVIARNNVKTGMVDVVETGQVDTQAVKAGLEMAYKLKGSYAPEKSVSLNINAEAKGKAQKAVSAFLGLDNGDTEKGGSE